MTVPYITHLDIKNFRGIEELSVSLPLVTLVTGANNSGKTSLLEAIYFLLAWNDPQNHVATNAARYPDKMESDSRERWGWLFRNGEIANPVAIHAETRDQTNPIVTATIHRPTEIAVDPETSQEVPIGWETTTVWDEKMSRLEIRFLATTIDKPFLSYADSYGGSVRFFRNTSELRPTWPPFMLLSPTFHQLETLATQFSRIQDRGKHRAVVEALQVIEPEIEDLRVSAGRSETVLKCVMKDDRVVPLHMAGFGMVRVAQLLVYIVSSADGVVLIDEFETGIHHSALRQIWTAVLSACVRHRVQVVATTHSYECLSAYAEAAVGIEEANAGFLRVEKVGSRLLGISGSAEDLRGLVEHNLEVR